MGSRQGGINHKIGKFENPTERVLCNKIFALYHEKRTSDCTPKFAYIYSKKGFEEVYYV